MLCLKAWYSFLLQTLGWYSTGECGLGWQLIRELWGLNIKENKNPQNCQGQEWLRICSSAPLCHNHKAIFIQISSTPLFLLHVLLLINEQYTWQRSGRFKTHYDLLVQRCHLCTSIWVLWMLCQETCGYSNPNYRPKGAITRASPTGPQPTCSLPSSPRWQKFWAHYHSPQTQQHMKTQSNIQLVTWTLNCEAKEKVLRKLEFKTWVSTGVMFPCLISHDLSLPLFCCH